MEWWTDLWLKEGFAQWIEYLCVDHCHPEYDIWTQFLSKEYASAMNLDALANSHPIEVGGCTSATRKELQTGSVWSCVGTKLHCCDWQHKQDY